MVQWDKYASSAKALGGAFRGANYGDTSAS
jgi:hypothetical protein